MPAPAVTIVSFHSGEDYYRRSANLLIGDCVALGLEHDIVEIEGNPGQDWVDICRKKIPFYRDMLAKHPGGILWVDADTRMLKLPPSLELGAYDFSAFLRDFLDLREFDAAVHPRTFHPGILHFKPTPKTKALLDHMAVLEGSSPERATDDYFFEEAWRSFGGHMTVQILAKDLISRDRASISPETCFLFGNSGNVSKFIDRVEQHAPSLRSLEREAANLRHYASQALKAGKPGEAIAFLRKARELAPEDPIIAESLRRLLSPKKIPGRLFKAVLRRFGGGKSRPESSRSIIEAELAAGRFSSAKLHLDRLADAGLDRDAGFIASRRFRLDLEERAYRMGIAPGARPKLWWMESPFPGNFGDILNPYVVEKLSGVPPRFVGRGEGILAIGSVIKFARAGTQVWGAGTPRMTDTPAPDADYRAVRGPLTRELVLRSGGKAAEIYGDAALLLPLIYNPAVPKQHKLGLIRHFGHAEAPLRLDGVREIDVRRIGYDQVEAFIRELMECEAILSTSLHGLIAAQAYGIPTRWCTLSAVEKTIPGDGTKFLDHYAALGIETAGPLDLSGLGVLDQSLAAQCTERPTRRFDALALLRAAPFAVQDVYLEQAARWNETAWQPGDSAAPSPAVVGGRRLAEG